MLKKLHQFQQELKLFQLVEVSKNQKEDKQGKVMFAHQFLIVKNHQIYLHNFLVKMLLLMLRSNSSAKLIFLILLEQG